MLREKIKQHFIQNPNDKETAVDIASILEITRETASRHLNKLVKEEFLEKDLLKPRNFWLSQSQSQSQIESQSQSQSQSSEYEGGVTKPKFQLDKESEIHTETFESQYPTLQKEAQEFEKLEEEKQELEELYQIAKETVINQKEEIEELQSEINNLKSQTSEIEIPKINLITFTEFSKNFMDGARKTGKNAYRKGEIAFRRSDIKNFYAVYSEIIIKQQRELENEKS